MHELEGCAVGLDKLPPIEKRTSSKKRVIVIIIERTMILKFILIKLSENKYLKCKQTIRRPGSWFNFQDLRLFIVSILHDKYRRAFR